MSNKKRKGPGSGAVLMLLAVGALGLGGLGAYVTGFSPAAKVPKELHRNSKVDPVVADRQGTRDTTSEQVSRSGRGDRVLVPVLQGEKVRLVAADSRSTDPRIFVANKALEALKMDGARVEKITVAGGVARIDFNQKAVDGMGSMQEGILLEALQKAMGQFDEIEMLRFSVNGKELETLGGHFEVMDGVEVIRPAKHGERP